MADGRACIYIHSHGRHCRRRILNLRDAGELHLPVGQVDQHGRRSQLLEL